MSNNSFQIALIIPTYNAEKDLPLLLPAIMKQSLMPNHILVIDSNSHDKTRQMLAAHSIRIHTIKSEEFDHGGTRALGTTLIDADIYIFLTQDAIPAHSDTFKELVNALCQDKKIGCAYGRQLPKEDATPLSEHARMFNYQSDCHVRTYDDRKKYGIKTCFNSDSFAAYKKDALHHIGNFPINLICSEDVFVAAKMLKADYSIAFSSKAAVYHSHNLSLIGEFHRYFSIGVFHQREKWILNEFSTATAEGFRFVKSEINYLIKNRKFLWIFPAFLSTMVKYASYQIGLRENKIPLFLKKHLGVNKSFWKNDKVMR